MANSPCKSQIPQYHSLFPDWTGPRPLRFFLIENLLESRRLSIFPTNISGPDEDVNIYLANLLTNFIGGKHPAEVLFGAGPLLYPPNRNRGRRHRAEFYRNNGDHRLIMLGLFDRGDHLRRRNTLFNMSVNESRQRDLGVGENCYHLAADILENRKMGYDGVSAVWRKLAENFEFYVQILATMAVRKLGLGTRLSHADLQTMLGEPSTMHQSVTDPMDRLLDLLLEFRKPNGQEKRAEIIDLALYLNLDPEKLLLQVG